MVARDAMDLRLGPGASSAPEGTIDGLPGGPCLWQDAQGATSPQDKRDGIQDRTPRMHAGAPNGRFSRQQRLEQLPFGAGQIGGGVRRIAVPASAHSRPLDARCE